MEVGVDGCWITWCFRCAGSSARNGEAVVLVERRAAK